MKALLLPLLTVSATTGCIAIVDGVAEDDTNRSSELSDTGGQGSTVFGGSTGGMLPLPVRCNDPCGCHEPCGPEGDD